METVEQPNFKCHVHVAQLGTVDRIWGHSCQLAYTYGYHTQLEDALPSTWCPRVNRKLDLGLGKARDGCMIPIQF
jgi:hypothetical protein